MHASWGWRFGTNRLGSYEHELGQSDCVIHREAVRGEMFFWKRKKLRTLQLVRQFEVPPVACCSSLYNTSHRSVIMCAMWLRTGELCVVLPADSQLGRATAQTISRLDFWWTWHWDRFLQLLWFSPASVVTPGLRTYHLHLHIALIRRINGRSLSIFKKQCCFVNRRALKRKVLC